MSTLTAEHPPAAPATVRPLAGLHPIPPPAEPERPRRRALIGLVVLALLLAVVARSALLGGGSETAAPPAVTVPPAEPVAEAPPSAAAQAVEAALPELQAFVSEQRDLAFLAPVDVTLLDDEAFRDELGVNEELSDLDRDALKRYEGILKALGLLTPNADLARDMTTGAAEGVLGLYDPSTKRLLVRGTELTPLARSVLVHELTHALDDQHFDLHRPEMTEGVEDHLAFRALGEGDATRVEDAYVAAMSPEDRASVEQAQSTVLDGATVEQQTAYYFDAFPYLDGPTFVTELAEQGGEAAVDAAFANPPRSTAEILVPSRYLAGVRGMRMTTAGVDGTTFDDGVIGALGLYLMLQSAVSPEEAALATLAWEGDSYLAWHEGERTCVMARFVLATPWETDFTAKLFERWAARQIDASITAAGIVEVTSCR